MSHLTDFGMTAEITIRLRRAEFNRAIAAADIAAISAPVSKFEQLLNDCTDALDPLSRFLGRHPAEQGAHPRAAKDPGTGSPNRPS